MSKCEYVQNSYNHMIKFVQPYKVKKSLLRVHKTFSLSRLVYREQSRRSSAGFCFRKNYLTGGQVIERTKNSKLRTTNDHTAQAN